MVRYVMQMLPGIDVRIGCPDHRDLVGRKGFVQVHPLLRFSGGVEPLARAGLTHPIVCKVYITKGAKAKIVRAQRLLISPIRWRDCLVYWNLMGAGGIHPLTPALRGGDVMQNTTMEDRRKELQLLLDKFRDHPERDWSAERKRAHSLSQMIAGSQGQQSSMTA